jgi:hypothetical protein
VVLPVPVITWRNKTISGDDAQNKNPSVIVGQPVELTMTPATLPGGFTVSKNMSTWTVDGTNIGWYDGSDAGINLTPTTLNDTKTTFYWLYHDTGLNVTYTYCATDPNSNPICTSPQAKATFEATGGGSSVSMSTDDYGSGTIEHLTVCDADGKATNETAPWMGYGDEYYPPGKCSGGFLGHPGIIFTASGGSSNGTYVFVQLIDSDLTTFSYPTGASFTTPGTPGLDGSYPYPKMPDSPNKASDGPKTGLPEIYETVGRKFNATMYLLWQPGQLKSASAPSIPVPIGYQEWQFDASTKQMKPGKWQKPDTTGHGDVGKFQYSTANDPNTWDGYPQW